MKKLNKILKKSLKLKLNKDAKIIIMSDCHRGINNMNDNFLKNKNIYEYALNNYYNNNFIYIELGDGDELWEVKKYKKIIEEHLSSFKLISKFFCENRFYMIYGNHDNIKKKKRVLKKYFYYYKNRKSKRDEKLLFNLKCYESISLFYNKKIIFLLHGHQIDFINSNMMFFSKLIIKYVWPFFENIGLKDPTKDIKNNKVKSIVEKKLDKWTRENKIITIAGHTHRPHFSHDGFYFNDGSIIHDNGITGIEIENGVITLVKWSYVIKNNIFMIEREVIDSENIYNIK